MREALGPFPPPAIGDPGSSVVLIRERLSLSVRKIQLPLEARDKPVPSAAS